MSNYKIGCTNCGVDFGQDVGAVGNRCPACQNGVIAHLEDD